MMHVFGSRRIALAHTTGYRLWGAAERNGHIPHPLRFWKDFDAQLADLTLHADIYGVGYR